jgi:L-asparaginase/Glu-tRNA(Gln) amidotransferase subunit D
MSNNSNLSALAAALDDGTSGQVLQSTGSGGVQLSSGTWSQVQQLRPDTGAAANASISINDEERIAIGSNGKAWVYVAS